MTLHILYRISDKGRKKDVPILDNKKLMFKHFIDTFGTHDIYVFADNVCDDTYQYLISQYDSSHIHRISMGNSKSFIHTLNFALSKFSPEDSVYFAEDDYIYRPNAPAILEEGLQISHYVSGYDHPDKYMNHSSGGPNPFVEHGGEISRVVITKSTHWKTTNSCCMTFATKIKYIREDYDIFVRYCQHTTPADFPLFCDLRNKGRCLISSIPGVSTHAEPRLLSPFIDWLAILDT